MRVDDVPLIIGHRGSPYRYLENTLASFKAALAEAAQGIELDVHLCKSGEAVVIHDITLDRTTESKGKVADTPLAALQQLGVPSLQEVLDTLGSNSYYFIEIKSLDSALPVAALVNERIKQGWDREKLWIISFDHAALMQVRRNFPMIYLGASFETLPSNWLEITQAFGAQAIIPHYSLVNQDIIAQATASGLKLFPWTVNAPDTIKRLAKMGVNGIITDYPKAASECINAKIL